MSCFGRAAELSRLLGLLREVPAAIVAGLPGLGKTELSYRLQAELQASMPLRVIRVTGEPSLNGHLYEHLQEQLSGSTARGALDDVVDVLAREPHLLVIDDGHFMIEEATALVDSLMRRITVASRLVVTTRTMLPVKTAPAVVRLEPLSAEDSGSLLEHLAARLGVALDDRQGLIARGMGSPARLRELVEGRLPDEDAQAELREALAELDDTAQRALVQLAAVTTCSKARSATEHLALPERTLQSLDRHCLINRGLQRLVVHDLVREVVLSQADASVVHASRLRAADALWQRYLSSRRADAALESTCLLTLAGEYEPALSHLQHASRTITNAGFDQVALEMLDELAQRGARAALPLQVRILVRLGRLREAEHKLTLLGREPHADPRVAVLHATLAERRGDLEAAERGYQQAIAAEPRGATGRRLRLRLAVLHAVAGHGVVADQELEDLRAELVAGGDLARELVQYWWARAMTLLTRNEWSEARSAIREGLRLASEEGDREVASSFHLAGLLAAYELGDLEQARTWAAELADYEQRAPDLLQDLILGVNHLAQGELDAAVRHLRSAYELHERERDVLLAMVAAYYLARALLARGTPLASGEVLHSAAYTATHHGFVALAAPAKAALARTLVMAGRLTEAEAMARGLLSSMVPAILGEAHAVLAYVAAFRGDLLQARGDLRAALLAVGAQTAARTRLLIDQGFLELLGGDPEVARAAVLAVADTDLVRTSPQLRGRVLYVLAVADLAAGLVDTALEALAEAEQLASTYELTGLTEELRLLRNTTALGDAIFNLIPIEHRPGFLGLMRVLGTRAGTLVVSSRHGRLHLAASQLPGLTRHFDLVIDRVTNAIRGPSHTAEGRATAAAILAGLAESRDEVPPERLYQIVWGGAEYHPLRHRNTLYIALNRTRKLLRELGETREIIVRGAVGWTLSPEVSLAIVRRDPRVSTVAAAL